MFLFVVRAANLEVTVSDFDPNRTECKAEQLPADVPVIYLTEPIFFGTAEAFTSKLKAASSKTLILSMRGVANVDISGVQDKVCSFFDRAEITKTVGTESYFWEASEALQSLVE